MSEWLLLKQERDSEKDVEKKRLWIVYGNLIWYSHYGNWYGDSSKNSKWIYHMDPAIPILAVQSKKKKTKQNKANEDTDSKRYMHP